MPWRFCLNLAESGSLYSSWVQSGVVPAAAAAQEKGQLLAPPDSP